MLNVSKLQKRAVATKLRAILAMMIFGKRNAPTSPANILS